ncbi:MAG: AI-2E family transporter [Ignavibacteriota bacterium]
MLGFDTRAARWTWTAVLVLVGVWLLYLLRSTLFLFVLAVLFAYLLAPLVNLIDRVLPGKRTRTAALAIAYVLVVGLAVLGASLLGSSVVQQANQLAKTFPDTLKGWEASFQNRVPDSLKTELTTRVNSIIGSLPGYGLQFLSLLGNLIYVVIIPILAFLCLKDGPLVKKHILGLMEPGPQRKLLDNVLADMDLVLAHYMRALVMLSATTFACYSIFLSIVGVQYSILLGVMAGMLEFIPVVGPLAASVVVFGVGGVLSGHVLAVLIFLVVFRLFQDYVISPHLMGQGVELHPLLVLFGVFAGAELAGVAGSFLSVPTLALVRVLYLRVYQARQEAQAAKLTQ